MKRGLTPNEEQANDLGLGLVLRTTGEVQISRPRRACFSCTSLANGICYGTPHQARYAREKAARGESFGLGILHNQPTARLNFSGDRPVRILGELRSHYCGSAIDDALAGSCAYVLREQR